MLSDMEMRLDRSKDNFLMKLSKHLVISTFFFVYIQILLFIIQRLSKYML